MSESRIIRYRAWGFRTARETATRRLIMVQVCDVRNCAYDYTAVHHRTYDGKRKGSRGLPIRECIRYFWPAMSPGTFTQPPTLLDPSPHTVVNVPFGLSVSSVSETLSENCARHCCVSTCTRRGLNGTHIEVSIVAHELESETPFGDVDRSDRADPAIGDVGEVGLVAFESEGIAGRRRTALDRTASDVFVDSLSLRVVAVRSVLGQSRGGEHADSHEAGYNGVGEEHIVADL